MQRKTIRVANMVPDSETDSGFVDRELSSCIEKKKRDCCSNVAKDWENGSRVGRKE